jgi:hypothetical protein
MARLRVVIVLFCVSLEENEIDVISRIFRVVRPRDQTYFFQRSQRSRRNSRNFDKELRTKCRFTTYDTMKPSSLNRRRALAFGVIWFVSLATLFIKNDALLATIRSVPLESDTQQSFAGCLLVMDDNHFLPEWLAYHYFVLPLRSLIVAVDPRSKATPTPIFGRWKDSPLNITVWQDVDFMDRRGPSDSVGLHRTRQSMFYNRCMNEHKRVDGATYTMLIDTDEYLMVNYDTIKSVRSTYSPVPISEPGSVLKTLQHERENYPNENYTASPCIQVPRIRFGSVESNSSEISASIPRDLQRLKWNASHFDTLRWRTHANGIDHTLNKASKVQSGGGRQSLGMG